MRIGSLFSGIGGLDLACEQAFNGETVWQVEREPYCQRVLESRWPNAKRHSDVREVGAHNLEPIDVLCGGFPCQDLSQAGRHAGLDGEKSGLYTELLRIAQELAPSYVVMENVPKLLHYRERLEGDFARIGYGLLWQQCEASDVGAPHKRRRVFALAVQGMQGSKLLTPPLGQQTDLFAPSWDGHRLRVGLWPTALANNNRKTMFKQGGEPLGCAVRWPTPTVKGNHNKASLSSKAGDGLSTAVKWPTPCSRDYRSGTGCTAKTQAKRRGSAQLPEVVGGCLNPAWVELLMGFPMGWTVPGAEVSAHAWPMGRGDEQAPHEPPRLVAPRSVADRTARLKALGNAVVPQQGAGALARMLSVHKRMSQGVDD
jgi:DNA (cytosine-5)-methyltransferase 1